MTIYVYKLILEWILIFEIEFKIFHSISKVMSYVHENIILSKFMWKEENNFFIIISKQKKKKENREACFDMKCEWFGNWWSVENCTRHESRGSNILPSYYLWVAKRSQFTHQTRHCQIQVKKFVHVLKTTYFYVYIHTLISIKYNYFIILVRSTKTDQ